MRKETVGNLCRSRFSYFDGHWLGQLDAPAALPESSFPDDERSTCPVQSQLPLNFVLTPEALSMQQSPERPPHTKDSFHTLIVRTGCAVHHRESNLFLSRLLLGYQ